MALKASYDTKDAIPEALRDLYTERDGKWWLDAEGVEDVSGLRSALNRQKQEIAALKEAAEKFKDIDPAKYQELLKKVSDDEEAILKRAGKHEEVYAQRLKVATDEHTKIVTAKDAEIGKLKGALGQERIENKMKSAAMTAGVREDAIDLLVVDAGRFWRLDEDGQARAYVQGDERMYGKDGEPISMSEFIANQVKQRPFLLKESKGSGANDQGNGRAGSGQYVITREQAANSRTYAAAKEAAAKQGVPLAVE